MVPLVGDASHELRNGRIVLVTPRLFATLGVDGISHDIATGLFERPLLLEGPLGSGELRLVAESNSYRL